MTTGNMIYPQWKARGAPVVVCLTASLLFSACPRLETNQIAAPKPRISKKTAIEIR